MKFVGVDVCDDGNRPAMSKHELVKQWPAFVTVRDVSSFVGFVIFYANWIPLFAQRISPLRSIITKSMDDNIGALTDEQSAARTDMISAICDDPVIARYDYTKRPYLLTDFSKKGFGYVICQPGDDPDSLAAMRREIAGGDCEFLRKGSNLVLRTTGFGSRASKGREQFLHSHIGEAVALDWAINKCRGKLWGIRFSSLTDCYALRFLFVG